VERKPQQLQKPKPEYNHPLLRADSPSETSIAVDKVCQPESNTNNTLIQVWLQDSIEGVKLTFVQESQQVLENNSFTGEPVIQEWENDPEPRIQELENNKGQPVIHQNTHRWLSRTAPVTVALLVSPFKHRSLSKPSGKSLSVSSASSCNYQVPYKSSDDESNGHGKSLTSSNLDSQEALGDGNDQSNGHNENPPSSDGDPDLEMEEDLGNHQDESGAG
jgi:hypothetical protein